MAQNFDILNFMCCDFLLGKCEHQTNPSGCSFLHDASAPANLPCQHGEKCKHKHFQRHWEPDSASSKCRRCNKKFDLFNRRAHCRECGQLCCTECCKSKVTAIGKVCDVCVAGSDLYGAFSFDAKTAAANAKAANATAADDAAGECPVVVAAAAAVTDDARVSASGAGATVSSSPSRDACVAAKPTDDDHAAAAAAAARTAEPISNAKNTATATSDEQQHDVSATSVAADDSSTNNNGAESSQSAVEAASGSVVEVESEPVAGPSQSATTAAAAAGAGSRGEAERAIPPLAISAIAAAVSEPRNSHNRINNDRINILLSLQRSSNNNNTNAQKPNGKMLSRTKTTIPTTSGGKKAAAAVSQTREQLLGTMHSNQKAMEALRAIEERVAGKPSTTCSSPPHSPPSSPNSASRAIATASSSSRAIATASSSSRAIATASSRAMIASSSSSSSAVAVPSGKVAPTAATPSALSKEIHKSLEACLEQERHLYTAIPDKFSLTNKKINKGEPHCVSGIAVSAAHRGADLKREEEEAMALILASPRTQQRLFSLPRQPASPLPTEMMIQKQKKAAPLPPRNVVPKSTHVVASARFGVIPEPSENRRVMVAEQKAKAAEKMMVKPGEKCPPPAHQFEFKPEEHTPLKKPADWVPAAASPEKFPAHWPQPSRAEKHVSPGLLRFNSSAPPGYDGGGGRAFYLLSSSSARSTSRTQVTGEHDNTEQSARAASVSAAAAAANEESQPTTATAIEGR